MALVDNGGAVAIKGFNYQKSVIMLIAVLHYLNIEDFEIWVESEDDIVVKLNNTKTYIQVKGKKLSIAVLTARQKKEGKIKDSIIEKNLSKGDESKSLFKIIGTDFSAKAKYLNETTPTIFRKGAKVYTYNKDASAELLSKNPILDKKKLVNSRLVLTDFGTNLEEALDRIIGIMASEKISVDNNYGMAALEELCLQIDQRSEVIIESDSDYEKKKFTSASLSNIFNHSYKEAYLEELLTRLDYNVAKKLDLRTRRVRIAALYSSYCDEAKNIIEKLDLVSMKEGDVMQHVTEKIDFKTVTEQLDREAITLEAFSRVLFEKGQA